MQKFTLIFLMFCSSITGCTNLFLRPDKVDYTQSWKERDDFVQSDFLKLKNGEQLHYWLIGFNNKNPKALVLQFHGNAENLSSHAMSVGWLSEHNYQIISFDYRGFGKSSGVATIDNALTDVYTTIEFVAEKARTMNVPLVLYGQSLGGSLLLKILKDNPNRWPASLVIIESAFYSYPQIAREKLSSFIITWPIQWLAYLLVSPKYNPGGEDLEKLSHLPMMFIYSEKDNVVPIHHGVALYQDLASDKKLFIRYSEPGHIAYSFVGKGKYRASLIEKIEKSLSCGTNNKIHCL